MITEYGRLTEAERKELAVRIARGEISRSCKKAEVDWFNIRLKSGRQCVGAYRWGSEAGEFLRFRVRGGRA